MPNGESFRFDPTTQSGAIEPADHAQKAKLEVAGKKDSQWISYILRKISDWWMVAVIAQLTRIMDLLDRLDQGVVNLITGFPLGFWVAVQGRPASIPKIRAALKTLPKVPIPRSAETLAETVGDLFESVAGAADEALSVLGGILARFQAEDAPGFYSLLATVMWDLTGVPVNADEIRGVMFKEGRLAGMNRIGAEIFNLLAEEFVSPPSIALPGTPVRIFGPGVGKLPSGTLSPEQGVDAARRFLGFLMTFSVREANMAFFAKFLPGDMMDNYGAFATELARNLGLGRMVRMALRPLFDTVLATPLEWALNKQYHPTRLTSDVYVEEYLSGRLAREALDAELDIKGIRPADAEHLISQKVARLTETDLFRLFRHGQLSREEVIGRLRAQGVSAGVALLKLESSLKARIESRVAEYVNILERQTLDGFIRPQEFGPLLDSLPLTVEEKRFERLVVFQQLELPRRKLTLAQMRSAFIDGIVDLGEWRDYIEREGFSDGDQAILTYQLLIDSRQEADARAAAELREAIRRAKGL